MTVASIAIGGTALLGYVGAQNAAASQKEASNRAQGLQEDQFNRGLELQREQFDRQQALQDPFRQAGLSGQNRLLELLGLGGSQQSADYGKYGRDFSMSDFQEDPGYSFRLKEGLKALDAQAAARG